MDQVFVIREWFLKKRVTTVDERPPCCPLSQLPPFLSPPHPHPNGLLPSRLKPMLPTQQPRVMCATNSSLKEHSFQSPPQAHTWLLRRVTVRVDKEVPRVGSQHPKKIPVSNKTKQNKILVTLLYLLVAHNCPGRGSLKA